MSLVDEAISFVRPGDESHLMLFNLSHTATDPQLLSLCLPFGPVFDCRVITQFKDAETQLSPASATDGDTAPIQSEFLDHDYAAAIVSEPKTETPAIDESPVSPLISRVYAHIHFYSINDARACHRVINGRVLDGSRIRATLYQRPNSNYCPRMYQLPTWRCLELMNGFVGFNSWSCSIRWIVPYNPDLHTAIIAGQTESFATEEEMSALTLAKQNGFRCSYACEVELNVPSLHGNPKSDVNVVSAGCSHGADLSERENCRKRAVTNAYRFLFAHLAIIRTKSGRTHVRTFEIPPQDSEEG